MLGLFVATVFAIHGVLRGDHGKATLCVNVFSAAKFVGGGLEL